jgi:hypothetical protein
LQIVLADNYMEFVSWIVVATSNCIQPARAMTRAIHVYLQAETSN